MNKILGSQKGISLVSLVIILAILFAALNAYAYFNPNFPLARFTLVNFLSQTRDKQRINDLATLQRVIDNYYEERHQVPATDGWCGRITTVLHPEFANDIKPYITELPHDPAFSSTSKDYFYYRLDRNRYILMAVLDNPPLQDADTVYNFTKCHDWPGNDVYNYQIKNF